MRHCSNCQTALQVTKAHCAACGLTYEGRFCLPRLARLESDQQHLVEQIVLAAGNLKDVAAALEVSYPTLRKRLDGLIGALRQLHQDDEAETRSLLDGVEAGRVTAEAAARLIREMNGGA